MPHGTEKRTAASGPSKYPDVPATPANVVTTPPVEIRRRVCEKESATSTSPLGSGATPHGPQAPTPDDWTVTAPNCALSAGPLRFPVVPAVPAMVVTTPAGVIF